MKFNILLVLVFSTLESLNAFAACTYTIGLHNTRTADIYVSFIQSRFCAACPYKDQFTHGVSVRAGATATVTVRTDFGSCGHGSSGLRAIYKANSTEVRSESVIDAPDESTFTWDF